MLRGGGGRSFYSSPSGCVILGVPRQGNGTLSLPFRDGIGCVGLGFFQVVIFGTLLAAMVRRGDGQIFCPLFREIVRGVKGRSRVWPALLDLDGCGSSSFLRRVETVDGIRSSVAPLFPAIVVLSRESVFVSFCFVFVSLGREVSPLAGDRIASRII